MWVKVVEQSNFFRGRPLAFQRKLLEHSDETSKDELAGTCRNG